MTDTDSELDALVAFAHELSPVFHAIELIPFHELGKEKYSSLDLTYELEGMSAYKAEEAKKVQMRLEAAGVNTLLSIV